jgi:methylmalonyl-CoA mutase
MKSGASLEAVMIFQQEVSGRDAFESVPVEAGEGSGRFVVEGRWRNRAAQFVSLENFGLAIVTMLNESSVLLLRHRPIPADTNHLFQSPMTFAHSGAEQVLAAALAQWEHSVETEWSKEFFEKGARSACTEGIALKALYTRADLPPAIQQSPGSLPYGRGFRTGRHGITPTWECSQEIAARRPADFNAALRDDLMQGQDSVVVRLEAGTRPGSDQYAGASNSVAARDLADLEQALSGIALDCVPVHLDVGADPRSWAATYLALIERQGLKGYQLRGSIAADPFSEWLVSGSVPRSLDVVYAAAAEWTNYSAKQTPHLATIGVNLEPWESAGASAVQELAFGIATAVDMLRGLARAGANIDVAAQRIRFRFATGPHFLIHLAKFRAFRLLWARVMTAFGHATLAPRAVVHARTGRWNKAELDPHANLLRTTTEACAAVLGGVDSLHIGTHDELTGPSNNFSRRIARNLHFLLSEEFLLNATADAAAGSYAVEKITDELARKAWSLFQELESQGGMAEAILQGRPQALVAATAESKRARVVTRQKVIVGVNAFTPSEILVVPDKKNRLVSSEVENLRLPSTGYQLKSIAEAIAAAKAGATVAEIADGFDRMSDDQHVVALRLIRAAEPFEVMRKSVEAFAHRQARRPAVFVARVGKLTLVKTRTDFVADFFKTAGFEVHLGPVCDTPEEAAIAAVAANLPIVTLCGTDEAYPDLVPFFIARIRQESISAKILLAGRPADPQKVAAFEVAGIDEFVWLRSDMPALVSRLLLKLELAK